ncbi:Pyridoxal kinase PdxY [Aestuariimicrobium sp. T2.26MG-19.2B]|nr:Pyridoxal kinase PdxY [Aestuariimicrobium sp. T2.26MG-19.2B]
MGAHGSSLAGSRRWGAVEGRWKNAGVTTILSIQSHVAFGHVGNSAAVFPLQRLGVEVWPVHTVTFSNHTGYGAWRGPLIPAEEVLEVVRGIDDRGELGRADAVLSGYQGGEEVGAAIVQAVALIKQRNPAALYCCDPVMGDVGRGFYARPGIPEFIRDVVTPIADVMSPNLFELEFLTGRTIASIEDARDAAHALRSQGPETVLVTSVVTPDEPVMRMLAVNADEAWVVETPLFASYFTGSGDLTSAMFLAHLLSGGGLRRALEQTAAIVHGVLRVTVESEHSELQLVAGQEQIVAPNQRFEATRLD